MRTGMYGLANTNHDLELPASWGKNIFTNTTPVSLAQYLTMEMGLDVVQLETATNPSGVPYVRQRLVNWNEIIGTDPSKAGFHFETPFNGFRQFTGKDQEGRSIDPEKSDVVVTDEHGTHTRALEIKLTVVPDSTTASKPYRDQGPEIVARPPTIEQLAYTIAESYGKDGIEELRQVILRHIPAPQQFRWGDHDFVESNIHLVQNIVRDILNDENAKQVPLVLNVIWRTEGQTPVLREKCFEVFVWTNLAFLNLFFDASVRAKQSRLTRPQRSLVWIVKLCYDYTAQLTMDRRDTFDSITFESQSDKAGSFSGSSTAPYLSGPYLEEPRIAATTISEIIQGEGVKHLAPERRLDATVYIQLARDGATDPDLQ